MGKSQGHGERREKRIAYRCISCGYRTRLTEREADYGMNCPECPSGRLFEAPRHSGKPPLVSIRPGVIRNAVMGVGLLGFGVFLLLMARSYLSDPKAGMVQARFIGHGIAMLIFGVAALVAALLGKSD